VKAQKNFSARNAAPLGILSVMLILSLVFAAFPFGVMAAEGAQPNARNLEEVKAPNTNGVFIDNGTIMLGVHSEGHLNVPGGPPSSGTGTTVVGLRYLPTGAEATAPGCLCEGWGAADAYSGVTGYANESVDGIINITPISFFTTTTTAMSTVEIQDVLRVTHDYHPTPLTPYLYEVEVTIENISAATVQPRYRRVMDWDIEPTAFAEYVTIQTGTASNIIFTSDDGFATANPLGPQTSLNFTGEAIDDGPADHGALWDFQFDDLNPGESYTFVTFYGAAGTEAAAISALAAVGAEAYSFGQASDPWDPAIGDPNTFIFAFAGVGGGVIFPSSYYIPQIENLDNSVSSLQLVNIGATDSIAQIRYYDQMGMEDPTSPFTDTVGAGETNTYFPVHPANPFDGSVVIEYTGEVAAISNFLYLDPPIQSSYQGFNFGGDQLVFPLIMKGNNFNDTLFNVQNTVGYPVSITIEFIPEPGMGYADIMPVSDVLPAWAAHTYDQRTMAEFAGVTTWVGSARVTVQGGGAVAGVAQQIDSVRGTGTAYTGFLRGSAQVETPLIMKENNDMFTSINCQNLSAMTDTISVTVEFFPEFGYPAMAPETVTDVPQYGTAVFIQYGGDQWVGAARVTNDKGEPLACIVNQLNLVRRYASAYQGFDANQASDLYLAPLVQYQDQGDGMNLWTSVNVQNLDTVSTTMVTMDYKPGTGYPDIPDQTVDIEPGAVGVFLFYNPNGDGSNSIGGAEIFSDNGAPLAVVVNQNKLGFSGDIYSTYNGFAR
jgi:hypothetical protein